MKAKREPIEATLRRVLREEIAEGRGTLNHGARSAPSDLVQIALHLSETLR